MLDLLKDKVGGETINGYLEKEKRSLDRELERFKRDKQKEKEKRINELQEMRKKRE